MRITALRVCLACSLTLLFSVSLQPAEPASARAFGGIQPVISPDASAIAVSFQGAIARVPSGGGPLTRLSREPGWDIEPAWSPDGNRIAYINSPGLFAGALRLIQAQDGALIPLPKNVLARGRLQFHPDGRRLLGLFAQTGPPDLLQWCRLETCELTPVNISGIEPRHRGRMKWALSPEGGTILFGTNLDMPGQQDGNNGPATDLWTVPSAGGEPVRLARWPARVFNLCWDPAGKGAYLATDRGGAHYDLWHLPLDGSLARARKLTSGQTDEDWPSVSADGRYLAHTQNRELATALERVELASGHGQIIQVQRVEFGEPAGRLRLAISDAQTGEPSTARVSVLRAGGKFHFPLGALYRFAYGAGHFYARHRTELDLPAGRHAIQAWRGPEFLPFVENIDIAPGEIRTLNIQLNRWTDMPARGWFSGENHIHANYGAGAWFCDPWTVRDQCEGEDLHVANVVVANSDGDGVFDRQFFLGEPDPLSSARTILYWNEEFRSAIWGHLTLGGLSRLIEPVFTGFKDTTNPWDIPTNADIALRARSQGGTVSYTHPAANTGDPYQSSAYSAKGLPVDAALGRVDTLDVMGGGYAGSLPLWYALLNCGFRIPAAAGTDVFLNRIVSLPPGWGRAYVKLTNGLTYSGWMLGQRAGRSFVTSGPMLEMTVQDLDPGDVLRLDAPAEVRLKARAWWSSPLGAAEVIVNGEVAASVTAGPGEREIAIDTRVPIQRGGWVAVRCSPPSGFLGAHMNPLFVEVRGHPRDARRDAEFLLRWIDRLEADLRQRDRLPGEGREHALSQLNDARKVYRKLQGID